MATATKTNKQRQQLTEGQLRKVIREEMSKMEGISEMSKEEKTELEEGMFDRFKANVAGRVAGAGASLGNLGSRVAATGRGAVGGAKAAFTGKSQGQIKGATTVDAALLSSMTAARSRIQGFMKQVTDLRNDMEKMNFGTHDDAAKKFIVDLIAANEEERVNVMARLDAALTAAKKGNTDILVNLVLKQDGANGGSYRVYPVPNLRRATTSAAAEPAAVAAVPQQAAESISRSVTNRLFEMNQKKSRQGRR
jgi:hypothetical protein